MEPLAVLNPGGRDAFRDFAGGPGTPGDKGHPPVNYHAYAACTRGAFCRDPREIPVGTNAVLVLLRRGNLRASLGIVRSLKQAGKRVWISLKESGTHQVAGLLPDYGRMELFRRVCAASDGALSSTPGLVPFYLAAGAPRAVFIPTPYPLGFPGWDFDQPEEKRRGIFIGTREFGVPSRRHLEAITVASEISREADVPVAVMNIGARREARIISIAAGENPLFHTIVGPLGYRDYLRLMALHRIVWQLDSSGVPGQVAGDACLCGLPCVGGDGAIERTISPQIAGFGRDVRELRDAAMRLLSDGGYYTAAVADILATAASEISFAAAAKKIQAFLDGGLPDAAVAGVAGV